MRPAKQFSAWLQKGPSLFTTQLAHHQSRECSCCAEDGCSMHLVCRPPGTLGTWTVSLAARLVAQQPLLQRASAFPAWAAIQVQPADSVSEAVAELVTMLHRSIIAFLMNPVWQRTSSFCSCDVAMVRRWQHSPASTLLWRGGHQAHLRARLPLRPDCVWIVPGLCGATGGVRGRCRAGLAGHSW